MCMHRDMSGTCTGHWRQRLVFAGKRRFNWRLLAALQMFERGHCGLFGLCLCVALGVTQYEASALQVQVQVSALGPRIPEVVDYAHTAAWLDSECPQRYTYPTLSTRTLSAQRCVCHVRNGRELAPIDANWKIVDST